MAYSFVDAHCAVAYASGVLGFVVNVNGNNVPFPDHCTSTA